MKAFIFTVLCLILYFLYQFSIDYRSNDLWDRFMVGAFSGLALWAGFLLFAK